MDAKGQKLKERLDVAREVNVTTKLGTDITFDIRGVKAIVNTGIYSRPGSGGNMPAGEVYIHPRLDKVEGTFYIDGSLRQKDKT